MITGPSHFHDGALGRRLAHVEDKKELAGLLVAHQKPLPEPRQRVSFHVEPGIAARLDNAARAAGRSSSGYIAQVLRIHCEALELFAMGVSLATIAMKQGKDVKTVAMEIGWAVDREARAASREAPATDREAGKG